MSILLPVWSSPPNPMSIGSHEVHVWRIPLVVPPERLAVLASLLSVEERQRADRFYFDRDSYRFLAAHGSRRLILGGYLRADPASLVFTVQESGKPGLAQKRTNKRLEFNLSHSGNWGLLAVALGRPVGVDIERIRSDFAIHELARQNFTIQEVTTLLSLPAGQQVEAFFACWTRKEAYIKAVGVGLSMPLDHFEVSLATCQPTALMVAQPDAGEARHWTMYTLAPTPGYAAALVAAGSAGSVYCCDLNA